MAPHEMSLDPSMNHMMIDSLRTLKSKELASFRRQNFEYLYKHCELLGHQQVLKAAMPFFVEINNEMSYAMDIFLNNEDTGALSFFALEIMDGQLPRLSVTPQSVEPLYSEVLMPFHKTQEIGCKSVIKMLKSPDREQDQDGDFNVNHYIYDFSLCFLSQEVNQIY
jgi:hypothetical protein